MSTLTGPLIILIFRVAHMNKMVCEKMDGRGFLFQGLHFSWGGPCSTQTCDALGASLPKELCRKINEASK